MRDICRKLPPQTLSLQLLRHIDKQHYRTFGFLIPYNRIGDQLNITSI